MASIHTGRPSRAGGPQKAGTPEKVLQAFNTWAFKREQPDSPQSLLQAVAESLRLGVPLHFVLYWGKGPRCDLDAPDAMCLDYLSGFAHRIREVCEPGAALKLIFTDTHAVLNGHPAGNIERYFRAVEAAARARHFDTCWLGELVAAAQAANAIGDPNEAVSEETLQKLQACAAKWFRGEGTPKEGAAKYFRMNMIEKRAVQFAFPRSIFVTFNGSEFRMLFPDGMPIFYMYSLRRGVSVKPWFLPAPELPAAAE